MIYTFENLRAVTNRKRPSAVKKWLQENGISYFLDADKNPVTTERAVNDALNRGGNRRTLPRFMSEGTR